MAIDLLALPPLPPGSLGWTTWWGRERPGASGDLSSLRAGTCGSRAGFLATHGRVHLCTLPHAKQRRDKCTQTQTRGRECTELTVLQELQKRGPAAGRVPRTDGRALLSDESACPPRLGGGTWDLEHEVWWSPSGEMPELGVWRGWVSSPGPLHHAPGARSTAGAPAWGSLSHSAHARPSRGDPALLPTFLFSHAAGGPLPPPRPPG